MDSRLKKIAGDLLDKDFSQHDENQIKSELQLFIKNEGGEDLLIDDEFTTLIELTCVFGGFDFDETLHQVNDILNSQAPTYKRTGKVLTPKSNNKHKSIIQKIGDDICNMHLDLHWEFKDKGICFIDRVNVVFSFEHLRQIEGMPNEYSGNVILNRIKTQQQLESTIDPRYINKKWVFLGKHNRCDGRYFTVTELMDLISNRKIITFDQYE